MDVHLRDLRYFLAVAEHLHFGRAAEAMFVSQPALSKQIRALEGQLRVALFTRDRRTVALTPAGAALVPGARAVLAAWGDAERDLARTAGAQAATLVVGISTGLGRGLLPAVRARFAEYAPHADLMIRQVPWDDPTAGLAAGEGRLRADAAFVWLPLPDDAGYDYLEVAVELRLVALPPGHRLATAEEIDLTDLLHEPFLALPRTAGPLRDYWLAVDDRGEYPVNVAAEIATTEETVEALTAGLGVCFVAAGNAPLIARDGIETRPVRGLSPSRLVFAWRADDTRPLLAHLCAAVEAARAG